MVRHNHVLLHSLLSWTRTEDLMDAYSEQPFGPEQTLVLNLKTGHAEV